MHDIQEHWIGLISSVYHNLHNWRSNQWPYIAMLKLYNWATRSYYWNIFMNMVTTHIFPQYISFLTSRIYVHTTRGQGNPGWHPLHRNLFLCSPTIVTYWPSTEPSGWILCRCDAHWKQMDVKQLYNQVPQTAWVGCSSSCSSVSVAVAHGVRTSSRRRAWALRTPVE